MSFGIAPNAMIDSVRLELLIGRGGMGDIWQGLNTRDQTRVAVKVLREEFLQSTQARERFRKEAELTEQLNSAQTLKVLKYALTPDRVPYIVMELLEGSDLESVIKRDGPLKITEALESIIELLKALSEAHLLGIVHRDIKPSNLFRLRQSGRGEPCVKILDFGLATQHNHHQSELRDKNLVGTYHFMAPEQAKREAITAKTDLYSVGATLYTLLTGHPPRVPTAGDKSFGHFEQPAPKLSDKNPRLKAPAKLDLLIQRCLSISPAERPENADVLRRALEQILGSVKRASLSEVIDQNSLAPHSSPIGGSRPEGLDAPSAVDVRQMVQRSSAPLGAQSVTPVVPSAGSFVEMLVTHQERLVTLWTQAITERPNQSRLQTHNLKRKVSEYLEIFIHLASQRPIHSFNTLLEHLSQLSFTHPPLELVPMITLSLFRRVVQEQLRDSARANRVAWSETLDELIFGVRQHFINIVRQKRLEETNNALYRLFSSGSETSLLCTLAGVAINTHPDLRNTLVGDEKSGLTGRKLFEILSGYQPIHQLYQSLREVEHTPPMRPYRLVNEGSGGHAEEIIVYPHIVGRPQQQKLLIMIDMVKERSITEFIPSLEFDDLDFASPQALPWQMTSEVPALKPEFIEGYKWDQPDRDSAHVDVNEQVEEQFFEEDDSQEHTSIAGQSQKSQISKNPPKSEIRYTQPSPIQKSGVWDNYNADLTPSRVKDRSDLPPSINPNRSLSFESGEPEFDEVQRWDHGYESASEQSDIYYSEEVIHPDDFVEQSIDRSNDMLEQDQGPPLDYEPMYEERSQSIHPSYENESLHYELSRPPAASRIRPDHNAVVQRVYSPSRAEMNSSHAQRSFQAINSKHPHPFINSRPPIAPDVQDYLAQSSSQPMRHSQHPSVGLEERLMADSSAPTDPPRPLSSAHPNAGFENHDSLDEDLSEFSFDDRIKGLPLNEQIHVYGDSASVKQEEHSLGLISTASGPSIASENITSYHMNSKQTADLDRGPATFNQHSPKQMQALLNEVAVTSHAPQDQPSDPSRLRVENARVAVKRATPRVSAVHAKVTPRFSYAFNTIAFLIFVACLFLLRGPVTAWIKNSDQNRSQSSQESNLSNRPLIDSKRSSVQPPPMDERNLNSETLNPTGPIVVTVKVNTTKAIFLQKSTGEVICRDVGFCAWEINDTIVVRSRGFYDRYLSPEQLREHANQTWFVELEAEPQR